MQTDSIQIVDFLNDNSIFNTLSRAELTELSLISEVRNYEESELIFERTDEPKFIFIIISGAVKLTINGTEIKTMKSAEIFGEIGVINQSVRSGETRTSKASKIIKLDGTKLFNEKDLPPTTALKVMRHLSQNISGYLITREQASTQEIINQGEGEFIEFKSTLRMNLRTGQKDSVIEKASLKTIAAFLNSKGGSLLIGVNDEGQILGMETDRFKNDDKLLLHITNLIKDKMGSAHLKFISLKLVPFEEQKVLRIDCQTGTSPAYLVMDGHEDFFIRTGPSTTSMRLSKMYDYIFQRFGDIKV